MLAIWVMEADGSDLRLLVARAGFDALEPAWPGGGWLAVAARAHPGTPGHTVALIHLGLGKVLVPAEPSIGRQAERAGLPG